MIKKNTVFDYLTHTMVIWGVSTISLCLFVVLFGQDAKKASSIFSLGNKGIAVSTLLQFLGLSLVITGVRWMFFSDGIIKSLSIMFRSIFMFTGVIVSVGIFAGVFQWFPVNEVFPWVLFFVSFFICAIISIAVSVLKEKSENKKMQEALERMKGE